MRKFTKGDQIFAVAPDDEESIEIAKTFIKDNKLTPKDVSLIKFDGYIGVVQK